MSIFSKIKEGILKTRESLVKKIERVVHSFTKIDEELFSQLEETLIMSDVGVETSCEICEQLRKEIKRRGTTDPDDIMGLLQEIIAEMMGGNTELFHHSGSESDSLTKPSVILVIGVNGVGKTTTIGKLCMEFTRQGKKVIAAAADTFRAAAIGQLEIWTQRSGADLVKHMEGTDPAAVIYDAISTAKSQNFDVLICDTAGRLHNKKNLMDELAKINRIIDKQASGWPKEVLLVLDATTGQNAVNQARLFKETANITGIVLTKLDGTAKGGIVISIMNELGIPVKYIGVGEGIDDLQPFDSNMFVKALFEGM
ncbi:MAG: signal recognition particle-docking protein FtsY [Oscillospiraceae bacterium]|jgi:fused signal recognition particle receptor|nr:signal recognition particle-docking protein FtsY [Oscillospiraceae bacterium]